MSPAVKGEAAPQLSHIAPPEPIMGGPFPLQADPFPETIVADFEGSRFVRATLTGQVLLTEPPDWCGDDPVPDYPYGSYGAGGVVELGGEFGLTVTSGFAPMPLQGDDPGTFVGEIAAWRLRVQRHSWERNGCVEPEHMVLRGNGTRRSHLHVDWRPPDECSREWGGSG